MENTIVFNLFGAPGAGKSTAAAYIFSKLKMAGINAELITEFAKDKVWEENPGPFKDQLYMTARQAYKQSCCRGKVRVILTDSPILLGIYYNKNPELTANFDNMLLDVFNSYNNVNYFINRTKTYNPVGRLHSESESDIIATELKDLLATLNIDYKEYTGSLADYDLIVEDILNKLA